ncbi:MAG: diphthine synthase [Candidatus Jordarchaeum sp.]|uniref:diphthine synthase n=1 Tax=Candidatus Jordarchaeum sp. TaxID=2823881 RepID=UPI00404A4D01
MGKLVFVGLGLWDEYDLTIRGLEEARKADKIYAEFYTSVMGGLNLKNLEELIGKKIFILSRKDIEEDPHESILLDASERNIVLLVAGDPLISTTHVDLRLRAVEKGIDTRIIHAPSILSAAPSVCGLANYKFGRSVSIPFPEDNYFPESPYLVVRKNRFRGLHTLVFLDIKADMSRYMTVNEGLEFLIHFDRKKSRPVLKDAILVGVARVGSPEPLVYAGYVEDLISFNFGPPPHILIVTGKLHFKEAEALVKLAGAPKKILER